MSDPAVPATTGRAEGAGPLNLTDRMRARSAELDAHERAMTPAQVAARDDDARRATRRLYRECVACVRGHEVRSVTQPARARGAL